MTKTLCKPCAVALAASGKTVKPIAHRCEKITYEVTGRAVRKKEGTKE